MATVSPNDGDLSYLKVIAQNLGENNNQWMLFREQLYLLLGTAKVKTIGLYDVATVADLPTPVGPGIAFTRDTQTYWVYSGGWKEIGLASP